MQRIYLSRGLRGLARGLGLALISVAALLALVCVLIVLEGQRDDLQSLEGGRVGAAIVLAAAQPRDTTGADVRARLDHALNLYRRGQVRMIVLAGDTGGPASGAGKQYLLGQGLPAEALLAEDTSSSTWQSLRNSVPLIQSNQIGAVVLVGDPPYMLRSLKMTRDLGLIAYGSPSRAAAAAGARWQEAGVILREAWAYLLYLFVRR